MSSRERLLAIGGGAVVAVLVLFFAYNWISGSLTKLDKELTGLRNQLDGKKRIGANGQRAAKKLAEFEQRALPSNIEKAQSLYQTWLLEQVLKHGLQDSHVNAVARQNAKGVYQLLSFSIKGQANLKQVTEMLHDFYAVDHLHRIRRLRLKPIEGTKDLDVEMLVEVLSLPGAADRNNLQGQPSARLAFGNADEYVNKITSRNFFAPPHLPPSLIVLNKATYPLGDSVVFSAKGEDPEKTAVSYAIEKTSLDGAKIDPKSGEFRWSPKELAKGLEVTIRATDGGMPAKSTLKTIRFDVIDPPPKTVAAPPTPPPPFDNAKYTYLTGVIDADGDSEAWLQVRTTGKMLKLREGAKFDIGNLQGTILDIGNQEIQVETSEGKRLLIFIGENLRDAQLAPQPTSEKAPATEKPETTTAAPKLTPDSAADLPAEEEPGDL